MVGELTEFKNEKGRLTVAGRSRNRRKSASQGGWPKFTSKEEKKTDEKWSWKGVLAWRTKENQEPTFNHLWSPETDEDLTGKMLHASEKIENGEEQIGLQVDCFEKKREWEAKWVWFGGEENEMGLDLRKKQKWKWCGWGCCVCVLRGRRRACLVWVSFGWIRITTSENYHNVFF